MPIGIPGSGKTRLYKKKYSDYALISLDSICKEVMGNVNDWSKTEYIFKIFLQKIDEFISKGESIYIDNCNLGKNVRNIILNRFKGKDIKVIYLVLPSDVEISNKRIKEAIKNNVERCHNSEKNLSLFMNVYRYDIMNNFAGENVQEIIYLKEEDLD